MRWKMKTDAHFKKTGKNKIRREKEILWGGKMLYVYILKWEIKYLYAVY